MASLTFIKPLCYLLLLSAIGFLVFTIVSGNKKLKLSDQKQDDDFEIPEESRFILIFRPLYRLFLPIVGWLPMPGYKSRISRYVVTAGIEGQVDGNDMIGFQISITLIFTLIGFIYFDGPISIFLTAATGLVYPYLWIYEKMKQRQGKIRLSMPDIIDMLSLSVEAGLSFNAAVQKVCEVYRHDKDPFVVELYLMDQNIKLGRSREEALKIMADRVDLMELDSFTSILIQANKMGTSIAETLKTQAERMRAERFLNAERLGAQASQKLLIPMMIFIFPIIFIVIFGPYVVKMIMG
jgi:tight adherence protein C